MKSLKRVTNMTSETNGADVTALLVTAHPDDECMFFAPTVIRLLELKARVHVLCLSEGTVGLFPQISLTNSYKVMEGIISRVTCC